MNRQIIAGCAILLLGGMGASAAQFTTVPERSKLQVEKWSGGMNRVAPHTDVIAEPDGDLVYYNKESAGTFLFQGEMFMYKDEFPATVIWGNDNKVWFKNLISVFPSDYYLEGTLEGNVITMATDQTIEYFEEEGFGFNFVVFKTVPRTSGNEEFIDFEYAPDITEIKFTVHTDGSLSMVLPGEPFDGENPPEYVAGLCYSDDYSFTGYCDFYQEYKRLAISPVTIPEDAEIEPYVFIDEYNYASLVDVAFYNDNLYIRGLSAMLPEGTIMAKIDGNKATVAQNEFLGIYFDQYYIFTKVLMENPDYNEDDETSEPFIFLPASEGFELIIDPESRTIRAEKEGVYLSFHCDADDSLNSLGFFGIFELKYQASAAGTPSDPVDLEYTTRFAQYQGFNDFFFTLSNFSTEGTLLDVEKLYYKVFVNGKPLVFNNTLEFNLLGEVVGVYPGVPYEVELIPYLFNNNEDIFKFSDNAFDIGIYRDDVETIGVQTVYYYENEVTYSGIVVLDTATGTTQTLPAEAGVSVVTPEYDGPTLYFSLDGRKLNGPVEGLYIEVKGGKGRLLKNN